MRVVVGVLYESVGMKERKEEKRESKGGGIGEWKWLGSGKLRDGIVQLVGEGKGGRATVESKGEAG